jgi:hypothetical protein
LTDGKGLERVLQGETRCGRRQRLNGRPVVSGGSWFCLGGLGRKTRKGCCFGLSVFDGLALSFFALSCRADGYDGRGNNLLRANTSPE